MMGRYLIFAWVAYDQSAGWHDFRSRHHTLADVATALSEELSKGYDCWQVVDLEVSEIVAEDDEPGPLAGLLKAA